MFRSRYPRPALVTAFSYCSSQEGLGSSCLDKKSSAKIFMLFSAIYFWKRMIQKSVWEPVQNLITMVSDNCSFQNPKILEDLRCVRKLICTFIWLATLSSTPSFWFTHQPTTASNTPALKSHVVKIIESKRITFDDVTQ